MGKTLNEILPDILARDDMGGGAEGQAQPEMQADAAVQQPETPIQQPETPIQQPAPNVAQQPVMPEAQNLEAILRATEAYQKSQQENEQLKARLAEIESTLQQQSQAAENNVVNQVMQPPKLNREGYEFLSDEEREQRESEYAAAMAEYTKSQVIREFSPALEYFQKQTKAAEYEAAKNALTSAPELSGIMDDRDGIDRVLSKTPELQNMDPQKQLLFAALINKGIKAVNTPTNTPTPEQIAQQAIASPEVMKIIETKRAQDIANKNQGLPNIAVNSGMSSAQAMPQDKPKTWAEAYDRARKREG